MYHPKTVTAVARSATKVPTFSVSLLVPIAGSSTRLRLQPKIQLRVGTPIRGDATSWKTNDRCLRSSTASH